MLHETGLKSSNIAEVSPAWYCAFWAQVVFRIHDFMNCRDFTDYKGFGLQAPKAVNGNCEVKFAGVFLLLFFLAS